MAGRCAGTKERRRRGVFQNTILYPIPGPMVEQGTWAAMADPGTPAAMAGQGNPATMAGQGSPAAMADQGNPVRWVMGDFGHGYIAPPKKEILGKSQSGGLSRTSCSMGHSGSADSWRRSGGADFVGSRTEGDSVGSRTGVDSVGSWTGTDGGGLVLDRAWTLSRHQRIPTLQLSPVVSERSTGQW